MANTKKKNTKCYDEVIFRFFKFENYLLTMTLILNEIAKYVFYFYQIAKSLRVSALALKSYNLQLS